MAQIVFNIGAVMLTRAQTAIGARYGYSTTIQDPANPTGPQIPNPVTLNQFFESWIKDQIRMETKAYEQRVARAAADNTITDIVVT